MFNLSQIFRSYLSHLYIMFSSVAKFWDRLQTKTLWTEKVQFGIQHFIHKLKPITVSTGQWVTVQVC